MESNFAEVSGGKSPVERIFWRWHFYAGLFAIPVIALLCVSGIIWLFSPQITSIAYETHVDRPASGARALAYIDQMAAVKRVYPGAAAYQMGTPRTDQRATMINVNTKDGRDLTVWVNPYSGTVLDTRNNRNSITALALELHGSLLTARFMGSETWGDRLIEIVAGWTIVLLVTGLYLFWPRGPRRSWRAAFTIRRGKERGTGRVRWRDIHAITGATFALITLFFLVTGMAWSGVWGTKFGEITTKMGASYPAGMWDGAESKRGDDVQKTGKGGWISSNLPLFPSGIKPVGVQQPGGDGHATHHHSNVSWDPADAAPLDAVIATAQAQGFPDGMSITFPEDEKASYGIWNGPDWEPKQNTSALQERTMYIDQYSAQPLRDFHFANFGAAAKANDFGIALHEGRQWGVWSQILMFIGTLAILLSCATSIVMWRKRKPAAIGAPKRTAFATRTQAAVVVLIAAVLGVFYPLLGLSMLAVLALDFVAIRFTPLRRIFG